MTRIRRTPTHLLLLAAAVAVVQIGGLAAAATALRTPDRSDLAVVTEARPLSLRPLATSGTEPTTTTSTTSTTAPAPTTTVPPAPATAPAPAPAPAAATPPPPPAPPAPAPAPALSPMERVQATFGSAVPAAWRSAFTVRFSIISGSTSWADHDNSIQIGTSHATASDSHLAAVVAHEFGHLIAFRYGSQAYNGAAPAGWPAYGAHPAEAWADCVSQVFTGVVDPSHGLPPCSGESLSWTRAWLAAGPPRG